MDEKPIDHARILKVTKLLKGLDLAEKGNRPQHPQQHPADEVIEKIALCTR